ADTERVYTLFLGPPEDEVEWNDEAVSGAYRFLNRVFRAGERLRDAPPTAPGDEELERQRHVAIQRLSHDLERFKFNTAVAALMELMNALGRALEEGSASRAVCETTFDTLLQLLHPFAPHLSEELWEARGHSESLLDSGWPVHDESKLERRRITMVVQVDGKLRERLELDAEAGEGAVEEAALESDRVRQHLEGRELVKTIVVPGRLINFVTRPSP
ncbi:MAG: class I tRNA ligase family protein, partial [Thermoanaerobaculia bacterium]|nr:class I tRNA ligase family protein [Thermoanaerobaculia bacterium]